jgi:phthalate 4,5-dioxygenase oxygenase subunit
MLSQAENEALTHVGPGTLMGNLLRRYWTPACLSSEIAEPDGEPLRVKLFGERLVAFRDTEGKVGLLQEGCPHRGASLFFGRNEECGLRCPYHGWKFKTDGQCVDQPSEVRSFAAQIKARSYPTHESGGMVWAYLGPPETMTPFRDFGTETLPPELQKPSKEFIDCNWVQSLDGDLDSTHISTLHQWHAIGDLPDDGTDRPGYPSNFDSMRFWRHDPAARLEINDEFYGYRYAALRTTPNGHTHCRSYAYIMPFTAMISRVPFGGRHLTIVPADDHTTWRYSYDVQQVANPRGLGGPGYAQHPSYPYVKPQNEGLIVRHYTRDNNYGIDREAQKHISFTGIPEFRSHDLMVTESAQPTYDGFIYDRTQEHLGSGDLAVARMHSLLLTAAKELAEQGKTPPGIGDYDFRSIRPAEKVLEVGEDWRVLGTDDDPMVQESMLALQQASGK